MRILEILIVTIVLTLSSCSSSTSKKNSIAEISTTNLSELNFWKGYTLAHAEYGTQTTMTLKNGHRIMQTNALPNHATGTFPNAGNPNKISAQDLNYTFPLKPTLSGKPKWAREPGIALNGVKFEPETAERFVCETGEVYKIEAFQELVDLGLDFNHAHVQPTGAYHYHGVPTELVKSLDKGKDIILVGFAKDGFPIYYSKSGQYKPSYQLAKALRTGDACAYRNPKQGMEKELNNTRPDGTFVSDWEYVAELGALDECNGTEINGEYAYFVTDEYPYMSRCLKGVFKENRPKLNFVNKAIFISKSPVYMPGKPSETIDITSSDNSGNGFSIIQAKGKSKLSYVNFSNFNTLRYKGWELSGSITFYEADVLIENCKFFNNKSTSALNIVRSDFDVLRSTFSKNKYQDIDVAYSNGSITHSIFNNTGGSAIDIKNGMIMIKEVTIINSGENGIIAGERSTVEIFNSKIQKASTAVASKDYSKITVHYIEIKDCQRGFTIFKSKPELGSSEIIVHDFKAFNYKYLHLIEPGSTLRLKEKIIKGN